MVAGDQLYDRPTLLVPQTVSYTFQFQALLARVALPFNQYSWPVPLAAPLPPPWSQPYNVTLYFVPPVVDITKIFRGIWRSLPDQPATPLLQQSPFPNIALLHPTVATFINRQQDWPLPQAPRQPAPSWTWSYNLNLIGQDKLPVGEIVTDRPTLPIPPAQTWLDLPKYNLIAKPFFQSDWPNPTQPYRVEQTWAWQYNKNLIAQDAMLVGEQVYELAPAQKTPEQTQLHTWQWSYNLSLIGQDRMTVGKQYWERPQLPVPPAQTWTDPFKIWLTAPVLNITISQYFDRPQLATPPAQSWTASYLLSLIGQDRMVVGEQVTDLPPRDFARLLQTWIQNTNLALLTAPPNLYAQARQQDWPIPRGAEPDWRRSWEWSYNKNLIGQDAMLAGEQVTELPPRDYQRAQDLRTWIQQVNLALTAAPTIPIVQRDWPLPIAPQQPAQSWTASYNLNLIGQDKLPFRQSDWPLTPAAQRPIDLTTWLDRVKFLLLKPTAQLDWPNPTLPARDPTLTTWLGRYNLNLIGQDRLPNRQQDWPLSAAYAPTLLQTFAAGTRIWLIPPSVLPPGLGPASPGAAFYDRPQLRQGTPADFYTTGRGPFPPPAPPVVTALPHNQPFINASVGRMFSR